MELTEEGKVVFEHATTMLSLEDNIKKSLKKLEKDKKTLSICACKSLGEYVLPCSIYTFKEIYTDVEVNLEVHNTNTVIKKLLSHDTNIGIITGFHETDNIAIMPILSDRLVLVGGPDEEYEEMNIEKILNIPLILREEDSNNRAILSDILLKHGLNIEDLNIILSSNSPESIKSTVASGRGFAFLPEVVIKQELRRGILQKINIKDFNAKFNYYLAYRNNYKFKGYEETFKNFITSKKRCFCY